MLARLFSGYFLFRCDLRNSTSADSRGLEEFFSVKIHTASNADTFKADLNAALFCELPLRLFLFPTINM